MLDQADQLQVVMIQLNDAEDKVEAMTKEVTRMSAELNACHGIGHDQLTIKDLDELEEKLKAGLAAVRKSKADRSVAVLQGRTFTCEYCYNEDAIPCIPCSQCKQVACCSGCQMRLPECPLCRQKAKLHMDARVHEVQVSLRYHW